VHEVIQAKEIGQVLTMTHIAAELRHASVVASAAEVGGDPTAVMEVEVELMTCQWMECRLSSTSAKHPQYYHLKVLTRPSFSSLSLPIQLGWYHLGQSWHLEER
jgi:hypothetical protein